ncbi:MAG: hypothetical protein ACYTEX_26880 [Planctomycetota bacterium]|jgi:hypothetical protein
MKPSDGEIYAGISKLCQNETIDAQTAKIAQLEKALELACHKTITPCPAPETFKKCEGCPGFYVDDLEDENEACTRGKMAHYMQKAKEVD